MTLRRGCWGSGEKIWCARPSPHCGITGESAGANVKAVQTMLGHKSAALTLDTYADLFPDDLEAVAAALDAAVRTLREPAADALRTEPQSGS
jgi:integrase